MIFKNIFIVSFFLCFPSICTELLFVDFVEGMKTSKEFSPALLKSSSEWRQIHEFYQNNFVNGIPSDEVRIPLVLHHIWLGSELPVESEHFRSTWIHFNPDWTFVLWTDDVKNFHFGYVVKTFNELHEVLKRGQYKKIVFDMRKLILKNQAAYNITCNFGEKSDILRYELLYEFGGVYVDTDFECLKPFGILHHYCDFYAGISDSRDFSFLNGLIGVSRHSEILKNCVNDLKSGNGVYNPMEIIRRTGPRHLTRSFFKALSMGYKGTPIGFPATVFYPLANWQRFLDDIKAMRQTIQPHSFAIHYWHTSWFQNKNVSLKKMRRTAGSFI